MNNNTHLNEEYKFKISYILNFFKDMVSESGKEEDKELKNRIEAINQAQDNAYINELVKNVETHEIIKKRKSTEKTKINKIEKEANSYNKKLIQYDEKEIGE